jgi:uncharacterized membrane protein YcaP (DUF421 family)
MNTIDLLFGHGKDLDALQMCCRAVALFFITLVLIRISGMRSFGAKTAFDSIIVIMLGAILSRAVTGASPAIPTILAGLVMCLIHRLLGLLAVHSKAVGKLIKGTALTLYKNGEPHRENMRRCNISMNDLAEGVRLEVNSDSMAQVKEVIMERNGKISVIKLEQL